jgi:hypothetical protein
MRVAFRRVGLFLGLLAGCGDDPQPGAATRFESSACKTKAGGQGLLAAVQQVTPHDGLRCVTWERLLRDLYLDDPAAAIEPYERYQAITGEERPVAGWIADVRRRSGIPAPVAVAPPVLDDTSDAGAVLAPDVDGEANAGSATEIP